jgi:hypothetical protein
MREAFDRIKKVDPKATPKIVSFNSPEFAVLMNHRIVPDRVLIGRFTVPSGANWILPNPLPMIIKLFSAADTQIPLDSRLVLTKRSSLGNKPEGIAQIQYSAYFDLTVIQQYNADFYQNILANLFLPNNGSQIPAIRFQEGEILEIYVEPPVAVDLDQPDTRFMFPVGQNNYYR